MLTVVMYHYVRDPETTPFPRLNARRTGEFEEQLDYVERHYSVVGCTEVAQAFAGERELPPNPCLLTFDDGLSDHQETVLPALLRRGLRGCFCPPARPVLERTVLDVQKSQFVLAASDDHKVLGDRILELAEPFRAEEPMPTAEELRARFARAGRYDGPNTIFAKRLLQDGLPERPRRAALGTLFAELVADDESAFANWLYMSPEDVRELVDVGMDVAGHGYHHRRLGLLTEEAQEEEIDRTLAFLRETAGIGDAGWTMCFPYGDRNAVTLRLLAERGCRLGLTTDVGIADDRIAPLELPRLDTNDLPVRADAPPSRWTKMSAA